MFDKIFSKDGNNPPTEVFFFLKKKKKSQSLNYIYLL